MKAKSTLLDKSLIVALTAIAIAAIAINIYLVVV
jgi:hypothetical protein